MKNRSQMTPAQLLAEDLFSNREWREDQNIAAGRKLGVLEMYAAAEAEAAYKLEQMADAEFVPGIGWMAVTPYGRFGNYETREAALRAAKA